MSVPIRVNQKVIGVVVGDTFRLQRDVTKHWLRAADGWAIDYAALRQAKGLGARVVEIHASDGTRWRAPIEKFDAHGVDIDLGFGRQRALTRAFWDVESPHAQQLSLFR